MGLAAGCATPGSAFPLLDPHLPDDAQQTCESLVEQLVAADVLRDAILKESAVAMTSDTLDSVANTVAEPITGAIASVARASGAARREAGFRRAVDAAEARLLVLLELRKARDCPAPAGLPAGPRTEAESLAALRGVAADRDAGRLSDAAVRQKTRKLFDELR